MTLNITNGRDYKIIMVCTEHMIESAKPTFLFEGYHVIYKLLCTHKKNSSSVVSM